MSENKLAPFAHRAAQPAAIIRGTRRIEMLAGLGLARGFHRRFTGPR